MEAAEEDLQTKLRNIQSSFLWGVKRRHTLRKSKRATADRVKLLENFDWLNFKETTRTHSHVGTTHSCQNSDVNNIVPTHIMLLSRDSEAFIPSLSSSCRFYGQQHVHSVPIQVMPFLWPTTRSNNTQTQLRLSPCHRPTAVSCAVSSAGIVTWQTLPVRLKSSVEYHSTQRR